MTYREKFKKEHPYRVDRDFIGGCSRCPHKYGYCTVGESLCDGYDPEEDKCHKCWDQEIPGTEKKIVKLPPDKKKEFKATYVQFSDYPSHREKVIYSTNYDDHFVYFVTESGVYAWNDEHHTPNAGAPIKANFYECRTYRDERGSLRTMYLDASTIHHIEFEEVEVGD